MARLINGVENCVRRIIFTEIGLTRARTCLTTVVHRNYGRGSNSTIDNGHDRAAAEPATPTSHDAIHTPSPI